MANAFGNQIMEKLHSNVRVLYNRRKKIGRLTLTNEEYLQTFVPREARDLFRDITPLIAVERFGHKFELRTQGGNNPALNASIYMDLAHPMPAPRNLEIQPDAPTEVVERINQWFVHGGDVSRDFGRVTKVLTLLNENFSRVAIRYYWPTILALCSENPQTKHLVQEMQEMRQPVKLKPLPPGLPIACRFAAETISTARLIPADVENTPDEEETYGAGRVLINIVEGQHYYESFGDFYGA